MFNVGVAPRRGVACARNPTTGNVGGTMLLLENTAEGKACPEQFKRVDILPLDDIIDNFAASRGLRNLPPPALLKVDCEGCEWNALSSLARHLKAGWLPPVLVVEATTKLAKQISGNFADDPISDAHNVPVCVVTNLRRFIPLGYRIFMVDMAFEVTPLLFSTFGKDITDIEAADLELDRNPARRCAVYLLVLNGIEVPPAQVDACGEW